MPLAPELHQGRLAIAEDHGLRQLHIDSPTAHQISAETDDARRWRRSGGGGPGVPKDGEKKTEQEWAWIETKMEYETLVFPLMKIHKLHN